MDHKVSKIWPFPYKDIHDGQLSKSHWIILMISFAVIHFVALQVSFLTSNFDHQPNSDHVKYMMQILDRGYPDPSVGHVPPLFSFYMAFKWHLAEMLSLPYWTAKYYVDIFMVILAGFLSVKLGQILTKNRVIAMVAGVCLIGAPIYIFGVSEGLALIPFQPLFLTSLILIVNEFQRENGPRLSMFALIGLLLGITTLIRGNTQFMFIVIAPMAFWILLHAEINNKVRKFVGLTALLVIFQFLVMQPWSMMQKQANHDGLMPFGGVYRAYYKGVTRHPGNNVSDWLNQNYLTPERSMKGVVQFNTEWLKKDPIALFELYVMKYIRTWYMSDTRKWDKATLLLHFPIWLAALSGLICWIKRNKGDPAMIFSLLIIGYMWSISAAMDGISRYMAPVYGLLGTFVGVFLVSVKPIISRETHPE